MTDCAYLYLDFLSCDKLMTGFDVWISDKKKQNSDRRRKIIHVQYINYEVVEGQEFNFMDLYRVS